MIVRINKPQQPALYGQVYGFYYFFKFFNWASTLFDIQQLLYLCIFFLCYFSQYKAIPRMWEQMEEWYFRPYIIATYLLMSTKRHLPCRECHEQNTIFVHKLTNMADKSQLVGNMLYNIMQYNGSVVKPSCIPSLSCT